MPELLLELFSEEIPARMQARAAEDLRKAVTDALVAEDALYEGASVYVTPRRLVLHIVGLPQRQKDRHEERKGPRVDAPPAAIAGFLKSAGLEDIAQAQVQNDPKKGDFYVAHLHRPGRETADLIAEIVPKVIKNFPWPKSMRWGANSVTAEPLRWVRPLHSIICTFGPENDEPKVIVFQVGDVTSGNVTQGHRFMAPQAFKVKRFDDYVDHLHKAKVVLDAARRGDIIRADATQLAFAAGLEMIEDEALVAETAGLVEWPVVLMGEFDSAFLNIPPEVIRATIRANQKCFVLAEAGTKKLANKFLIVANIEARDGGKAIAAGNGRVVRARLSDAKFFWEGDLKTPLAKLLPKLEAITFQEKLGTQRARVARIEALARHLARELNVDPELTARAALLAKADLVSEMVGEFPELQGLMGRYYALAQGENAEVATALEDHYKPQGPSDRLPQGNIAIAVALADKLDTLAGFWAINEKPTGSKDPYALRRAALGIIRIMLEQQLPFSLDALIERALVGHGALVPADERSKVTLDLAAFFRERLKVYLRDKGARHDYIEAALTQAQDGSLLDQCRRLDALSALLEGEDGQNLLAGFKRASNILRAEEKKDGARAFDMPHEQALFEQDEELALARALAAARQQSAERSSLQDYAGAMRALAQLRAPLDAFFDRVTVNDENADKRRNRLHLLSQTRRAMNEIADFSKISG